MINVTFKCFESNTKKLFLKFCVKFSCNFKHLGIKDSDECKYVSLLLFSKQCYYIFKRKNNRKSTIKVSFKMVVEKLMQLICMRYLFDQEPAKKCTLMILSYLNDGYIMTIVRSTRFKNCLHLDVFMYHSSDYSGRHEN